jgi:hypothetical protein
VTSSVQLGPGECTTFSMQSVPPGPLTVELRGAGSGAVAFVARTPQGVTMATGTLTEADEATCRTDDGELIVEFTALQNGGAVRYVARSRDGLSITLAPRR